MKCGERDQLEDDHHLWRRVKDDPNTLTWVPDEKRWVPSNTHPSNSIQFDPELSTFWREHLEGTHRLTARSITDEVGGYTLAFEMKVEVPRELGACVVHSPTCEKPIDCAHTSVFYPNDMDKSQRFIFRQELAHSMFLVSGSCSQVPPPGA